MTSLHVLLQIFCGHQLRILKGFLPKMITRQSLKNYPDYFENKYFHYSGYINITWLQNKKQLTDYIFVI